MPDSIALRAMIPEALYYLSPLLLVAGLVALLVCLMLLFTRR